MSESYTTGDDTNFQIIRDNWIAQTFTPVEDHRLWFVHLKLHGSPYHRWALMSVQNTLDGIPTGEILDEFPIWLDDLAEYSPGRIWRPTLHGTANLLAGTQYAIVISRGNMRWGDWVRWRGQSTGATYPRGQRLSSSDGGASWTPHPDSDCYFVEFGTPPLPKPEPPPPINHFAPLSLTQTLTVDGIIIKFSTNVPCHLTLYWTDKKPLKHPTERTVRGLTAPWATYFCFVAWHAVEQSEPGDTLYHTFDLTPWEICQTRWFTIRGNVDEKLSPSIGPIFKKHRSEKLIIIRSKETKALRRRRWTSYLAVHDSPSANEWIYMILPLGQSYDNLNWEINRLALLFDTSEIPPGSTITHASISLDCRTKNAAQPFDAVVVNGDNLHDPLTLADYGGLLNKTESRGLIGSGQVKAGYRAFILLTDAGKSEINKGGLTKFGIRSSRDIGITAPTADNESLVFRGSGITGMAPVFLRVTYKPP